MGPPDELLAYLSRPSEGHSVLDAVRAARTHGIRRGDRSVVSAAPKAGTAGSANELAAGYAPMSTCSARSPCSRRHVRPHLWHLDALVARVVGAMGLLGMTTEHPEIALSDYVSAAAMPAFDTMRTECLDGVIVAVVSKPFDTFYVHDPITTEPARSIILANDVGNVRADSPVLLVQGTADVTVFPARTHDLLARMCGVGQVTDYVEVPGADHQTVTGMAIDQIESWLADRFAGRVTRFLPEPAAGQLDDHDVVSPGHAACYDRAADTGVDRRPDLHRRGLTGGRPTWRRRAPHHPKAPLPIFTRAQRCAPLGVVAWRSVHVGWSPGLRPDATAVER